MKTTKKFLSLVLTLIMLFSVVPMTDLSIEASAVCYEHNFVNYPDVDVLKTPATCTKKAVYYKTCENCLRSAKELDVDQTFEYGEPHAKPTTPERVCKPDFEYLLLNATCVNDALYSYVCRDCYEPMIPKGTDITDPWLTIRLGIEVYIKEGTATNPGHLNLTKLEKISDGVEATCTKKGKTAEYRCNEAGCQSIIVGGEVIPARGHNFNYVKSYKAPTCKNAGNYDEKYCSRCKETFYFDANGNSVSAQYVALYPLNALGHIDNNVDYTCDRCYALLEMPEPELPEYEFENGYYYTLEQGSATIYGVDLETKGKIVIPSTLGGYPVTAIGEYAFSECFWLTDVVIPETVKFIGEGAFAYCIALKEIVIPESVTSIGDYAFVCCMSLERIIFKNSSVDIGDYVGYTDMLVKEGHTLEEWLNKFYKIADAELNGGADDALYEDILAITILCDDIVVKPNLNIYGYESSTAYTFAIANGMHFKNIGEYFKNDLDISTGVEVVYPTDAFGVEVDFVVKENAANANIVIGSIFTKYKSYDISFEAEGLKVQPNGKVTVKLPIPEGYNKAFVYAYYIDDIGSKTRLDSRVENGFIIFETNHFSEYVIVDESSKIDTPDKPDEPCTCNCHAGGIKAFFFKLINFFAKLFNPAKRVCACGVKH